MTPVGLGSAVAPPEVGPPGTVPVRTHSCELHRPDELIYEAALQSDNNIPPLPHKTSTVGDV